MSAFRYVVTMLLLLIQVASWAQTYNPTSSRKRKCTYQQINAEEMIRRFVSKPANVPLPIEGIYTVSAVVVKRHKPFLSSAYKDKVVDRRDNYARVAIMKDWTDSRCDFIEVSMREDDAAKFPIVGELITSFEGRGFLCRHFEPNGEVYTFSFTIGENNDMLEGVFTTTDGKKTITYNLTYLKIFPKAASVNQ
jgi:hypothetical protein